MSTIPIPPDVFTVLLIFETRPDEGETLAAAMAQFVRERCVRHRGFVSAQVYVSDDQRRVIELFQWARPEDWTAYRTSPDGREGLFWLKDRHPQVHYLEPAGMITAAVAAQDGGTPGTE